MDVSDKITYPTPDPAAAFALIADRRFREQVCKATMARTYDVSPTAYDGGGVTVTVTRELLASLPPLLQKMVGETVKVVQTETWSAPDDSGQRSADLLIEIVGQPAKMTGTMHLRRVGDAVVQEIRGEVKASVPFVGRKIETELYEAIRAAIAVEQRLVTQRLTG